MAGIIIIGAIIIIGIFLYAIGALFEYLKERHILRRKELIKREKELKAAKERLYYLFEQNEECGNAVNLLASQKAVGFPWLANAYADLFHYYDLKRADYLESKTWAAPKAAQAVREVSTKRRRAEKLYRILKYQIDYYEKLFPWLEEFKSEDIDDLLISILNDEKVNDEQADNSNDDPAKKWLTSAEYKNLSKVEKFQIALDRYKNKRKNPWEIGRDYERYIGFLYENAGFKVHYQGIIKGLKDLGRDLIATKDDYTEIIQCKCWSQHKTIHEKHIFQLFGTTVEYYIKNSSNNGSNITQISMFSDLTVNHNIQPTFITSTCLSEDARKFADVLNVKVLEEKLLEAFPLVKCNVSKKTGERIYHLPFDQQYDNTIINEEENECYAWTVSEAEERGFRRAYRWRGEKSS